MISWRGVIIARKFWHISQNTITWHFLAGWRPHSGMLYSMHVATSPLQHLSCFTHNIWFTPCWRSWQNTLLTLSVYITIQALQRQGNDRPPLAYCSEVCFTPFFFFFCRFSCQCLCTELLLRSGALCGTVTINPDCLKQIAISRQRLGAIIVEMKHC